MRDFARLSPGISSPLFYLLLFIILHVSSSWRVDRFVPLSLYRFSLVSHVSLPVSFLLLAFSFGCLFIISRDMYHCMHVQLLFRRLSAFLCNHFIWHYMPFFLYYTKSCHHHLNFNQEMAGINFFLSSGLSNGE